ncbi:MAG: hotdog domain-containing protein [Mycobacteriaceae bacterium]
MSPDLTPESMFRVHGFAQAGDDVGLRMGLGDWVLDDTGAQCPGALGVFLDDAVGHQVFLARPSRRHGSVTSELSLDFLPGAWSGDELQAVPRSSTVQAGGAFTRCEAVDATGQVVAVVSNWGRFIELGHGVDIADEMPTTPGTVPDPALRTLDLLGGRPQADAHGATLELAGTARLANPMGIVHGGIVVCASERVAHAAVSEMSGDTEWRAGSLRVHYLRPTPVQPDVRWRAQVVHHSRSVAVVRVQGGPDGARTCTEATVTFRRDEPSQKTG